MTKDKTFSYQNIFLLIVSIIFAAILAEIALRIILPPPMSWIHPQEKYIYDPELGFWMEANQIAYTHDKTVRTNSIGIRDSEYPSSLPRDTYRILALGDSQTFGNGLALADTWPKQLETILNEKTGIKRFEVLNAGIPGSATWQHEIILQRMIDNYHPDMVVLGFYVNDVTRRYITNISQQKDANTLKRRIGYKLKQSALLLTFRSAFNAVRQRLNPDDYYLWQLALLNGDANSVIEEGWKQVEASLYAMNELSAQHDVNFVVASIPRRDQVSGNTPGEAYNKRLQAITERHQISILSMLDPLKSSYKENGKELFIPWDGHNSVLANLVISGVIADFVMSNNKYSQ